MRTTEEIKEDLINNNYLLIYMLNRGKTTIVNRLRVRIDMLITEALTSMEQKRILEKSDI